MTTAITNATPWDATPVEPTESAHGKRHASKTSNATGSVLNAFAATLAAMLGPAQLVVPTPNSDRADSELDASTDGATAKNGAKASVASGDPSTKGSTNAGTRESRITDTRSTDTRNTNTRGTDPRTIDTRTTETRTTDTRTTTTRTAAPSIDVTLPGTTADGTNPAPVAIDVPPVPQLSDLVASTTLPTAPTVADRPAFAAAAEARAAAKTAPVSNVNADTDALNPEFRTRLGRVVTRMREEYGHDVELVEGFRPQSRQDFLYEQGRTRPGAVVTWTRSSKHTLGLAADLKIDGSYYNSAAYQQLARIAQQEGLRTLGTRDPGHVELPNRGGAAAWGAVADTAHIDENVSRAVGLALAGDTAPATDASSSNDAINGLLSRVNAARAAVGPHAASSFAGMQSGFGGGMNGGNGGHDASHQQAASQRPHSTAAADQSAPSRTADVAQVAGVARVADVAQVAQVAQVAHVGAAGAAVGPHAAPVHVAVNAPSAPLTPNGAASAERVGRMLDVRDATPAQPLSHVTLNLDNANGGTDRITVQLRGGAVDTSIALGDTSRADRMSLRVGELQHALEQHGLETGAIRVAQPGANNSAGWTPRQGGDQGSADQRPAPNHRDHRQDADDARQRSRREQHGGKQQ